MPRCLALPVQCQSFGTPRSFGPPPSCRSAVRRLLWALRPDVEESLTTLTRWPPSPRARTQWAWSGTSSAATAAFGLEDTSRTCPRHVRDMSTGDAPFPLGRGLSQASTPDLSRSPQVSPDLPRSPQVSPGLPRSPQISSPRCGKADPCLPTSTAIAPQPRPSSPTPPPIYAERRSSSPAGSLPGALSEPRLYRRASTRRAARSAASLTLPRRRGASS